LQSISQKIRIYFFIFLSLLPLNCYAQQAYLSDDDVSAIFVSGGYGALFGAAMGAAFIPFMDNSPMQNLRFVAGGASIGFMLGSAYGFYNLANANRNSYFNYNANPDDDGNSYYSMPPTMPTQGKNNVQTPSNLRLVAARGDAAAPAKKAPVVGALFMGDGQNINMAVPYFWVSDKKVSVLLAYLTF
jgi:hypothetical protein